VILVVLFMATASAQPTITNASDSIGGVVDSLFVRASSGELKFRDLVEPSRKALIDMGASAVPRMLTKLKTRDAREMLEVSEIFKGIGEPAVDSLCAYVNVADPFIRRLAIRSLDEIKSARAVTPLINVARHEDFRTRAGVMSALGNIGRPEAAEVVMAALVDSNELVATAAAAACGKIKTGIRPETLIRAISHPYYGVRYTAAKSLGQLGAPVIPQLESHLLQFPENLDRAFIMLALGETKSDRALKPLKSGLASEQWLIRASAGEALGNIDSKKSRKALNSALKIESHPLVKFQLRSALEKLKSSHGS